MGKQLYMVATAQDEFVTAHNALSKIVQGRLADGWRLQGGVSSCATSLNTSILLSQALVKDVL